MAVLNQNIYIVKLKASSLVEVTTAMVLVILIFGIALMIFFNVTSSSLTLQKLKYKVELQHYAQETIFQRSFLSDEIELGNITIIKHVETYQGDPNLVLLHFRAILQPATLLADYKTIVYVPEE
jgi:hypothetical protein